MKVKKIEITRPDCMTSAQFVVAIVHMDVDLSNLFPYLNATQQEARYYPKHPFINFLWGWHKVVVEANQIRILPFEDEKAAEEGAKKVVNLLLEIESKKGEIVPDLSPYDPPKVFDIYKLLPKRGGCNECGYTSCMAFAAALINEEAGLEACKELQNISNQDEANKGEANQDEVFQKLKEILGV